METHFNHHFGNTSKLDEARSWMGSQPIREPRKLRDEARCLLKGTLK
jgi:hypothetical protein